MSLALLSMAAWLAGTETIAMTAITQYSRNKKILFMATAIILYGLIIPYSIYYSLSYSSIGTINFTWNIITTVSMIIIGRFLFNDKMTHLHIISLLMGIGSMAILYIAEMN